MNYYVQGRNSSEASSDADEQMLLAVALACCARHGTSRASVLALRGGRGADPNRPHPNQGNMSAIRGVRALRPLRALKRVPGMPVLVASILKSIP